MENSIGAILADVSRLMRRAFNERARTIGVTRPQWQVLSALKRHEGYNQGRLAELLDVEPITLSRMVDRMQKAGLVERRPDPDDRRAWRLFLTEKAQEIIKELRPISVEIMAIALDGISEAQQESLREILDQIRHNFSRQTDGTAGPLSDTDEHTQN